MPQMNMNWRYVSAAGADTVGWSAPTADQPLAPYERMGLLARELAEAGFTAVLLPPSCKGGSGGYSNGYDLFDPFDIGSKDQCGTVPTAFGTAQQLRQCVARIKAARMDAFGDLVLHQYGGGTAAGEYTYSGSGAAGRFPKHASCFVGDPPRVEVDPVPDTNGNFPFGDMASYVNSTPAGYMHDGAIAAAGWLVDTVGFDGLRIDDVKGTNGSFVYNLITSGPIASLYVFGEYYDSDGDAVSNWIHGYECSRASAMDFAFKFNVGDICNNNSNVWMGQLADIGYCCRDPLYAVTFVESADTDTSPDEQTIWNKVLGYALLLTFPGDPQIYYRDWAVETRCYGLKAAINNLVWIWNKLAQGEFVVRLDTEFQVFVHERLGYGLAPGCVCFFNNDQWNEHTVTVQTARGPNARMHEYTGNGSVDDIWTDAEGRLTVTIPRNNNGYSYLVYGPAGVGGGFDLAPRETAQTFYGAFDLDLPPLTNGDCYVGEVWCAADTLLSATLTPNQAGWGNDVELEINLLAPDGSPLASHGYDDQAENWTQGFTAKTKVTGWHTVRVLCAGLPAAGSSYGLRVNYTAD